MPRFLLRSLLALMTCVALMGAVPMTTPKDDCEALLNAVLPLAEKFLNEHGEFYPFGATLGTDGKQALTAAHDGADHTPSQPLIELLRDGYRKGAKSGKLLATALAYDVLVVPPGGSAKVDAVAVELDHRADYSVVVFFPYRVDSGKVEFGSAFVNAGEQAIFGKSDGR